MTELVVWKQTTSDFRGGFLIACMVLAAAKALPRRNSPAASMSAFGGKADIA
jgi:hypothetical protein